MTPTHDDDLPEPADQVAGETPTVMTVEDLAAYLQVSPKSVYKMAQAHEVPAAKVAGQWRFYRPMIDRWLLALSRQDYQGPDLGDLADLDPEGGGHGPV